MEATHIELYKGVFFGSVVYITAIHSKGNMIIVDKIESYEDASRLANNLANMLMLTVKNKC